MAKTIFEELGGKYERQGDYLIPCLTVPAEEEQPIGIWGQRHLDYLKQYRKVTYTNLLTSGRALTLLSGSSGSIGSINLWSSASFLPSFHPRSDHRCTEKRTVCKGKERRGACAVRLYPEDGCRYKRAGQANRHP